MKPGLSSTLIALLCASLAFSPCVVAKDKDKKKDDDKKEQLTPKQ